MTIFNKVKTTELPKEANELVAHTNDFMPSNTLNIAGVEEVTNSNNQLVAFDEALFELDAGAGQESMQAEDYAIPRLTILQSLSPQIDQSKPDFKKYEHLNARPGMIYDTVTNEVYPSEGITLLIVAFRIAYIEWKLRENGGGFVKDHDRDVNILNACTKDTKGRDINSQGNQISTTAEYFAFLVDESTGAYRPVVLSLTSSQLKKARRLNMCMNQYQVGRASGGGTYNPATFYRAYRFATMPEGDGKHSWFGWDIRPHLTVKEIKNGEQIYVAARAFNKQVLEGKVKASAAQAEVVETSDDSEPF